MLFLKNLTCASLSSARVRVDLQVMFPPGGRLAPGSVATNVGAEDVVSSLTPAYSLSGSKTGASPTFSSVLALASLEKKFA